MNRKFKALGLALFAALALSAVGASAASADDIFKSAEEKTIITSTEKHVQHEFHAFGSTVECEVTKFSGTQDKKEAKELTVTPTYDKCEWNGLTAEVRTNHCTFTFTSETVEHEGKKDAPVHVGCETEGEGGEHIEIEIPSFGHCNFTVQNETTTGGVAFTNEEESKTVTVDITASIKMHRDSGSFLCNILPTEGSGVYTGASTLIGYKDNGTPTTANETITFVGDATATTDGVGTTHWDWSMKEGEPVDIEVVST